jgi:hypothetical protein
MPTTPDHPAVGSGRWFQHQCLSRAACNVAARAMTDNLHDKIISLAKVRETKIDAATQAEISAGKHLDAMLRNVLLGWMNSTGTRFDNDRFADVLFFGSVFVVQTLIDALPELNSQGARDLFERLRSTAEEEETE